MPTQAEIEGASPLTDIGAELLGSYIRSCAFYLANSWAFTDLDAQLAERVGQESTKSRLLSSLLVRIEALGDGTVGVKGGKFGADYSQSRDRDQLCVLALSSLFDFAQLGLAVGPNGQPNAAGGFLVGGKRGGEICDEVTILFPKG